LLTDHRDRFEKMLNFIRAGAYFHVAAAAIGIPPPTFSKWLSKGERAKKGIYREFREAVLEAVAEASVVAEAELKQSKPETWLRNGPRRLLGEEWREAAEQPTTVVDVLVPVPPPSLADLAAAMVELAKAGVGIPVPALGYSPALEDAAPAELDGSAVLTG
jgi:hypothetical protein